MYRTLQGQAYVFYTPMATNAVAPAAALGTYVISSPGWPASGSQRGYDLTTNGLVDRSELDFENNYGDFNSALQQITNGAWNILFTNATTTNHYTFTVTAPTATSNMLPATMITFPSALSLNVPNQPTFTLAGGVQLARSTPTHTWPTVIFPSMSPPASRWARHFGPFPPPFPIGVNCSCCIKFASANYTYLPFSWPPRHLIPIPPTAAISWMDFRFHPRNG